MAANKFLEEVLGDINRVRARFKQPPLAEIPKGRIDDDCKCPVANALASCFPGELVSIDEETMCVYEKPNKTGSRKTFTLPRKVTAFIIAFDARSFPQFEEAQ